MDEIKIGTRTYALDKKYAVESQDDQRKVTTLGQAILRDHIHNLNLPALPVDFDWSWQTAAGRLTTRMRKHWYKEHGVKVENLIMENVGVLAQRNLTVSKLLPMGITHFDFTRSLRWRHGDFGDNGSCWWTDSGYAQARTLLLEAGGCALRWFRNDGTGASRCWMLFPEGDDMIGSAVLFNSPTSSFQVYEMANFLAQLGDVVYQKIQLDSDSTTKYRAFINSGQFVVGTPEQIESLRGVYTFSTERQTPVVLPDDADEIIYRICYHCGEQYDEMEMNQLGASNDYVCESCQEDMTYCDLCRGAVHYDDLVYVDDDALCESCISHHTCTCDSCDTLVMNDDTVTTRDDRTICSSCADNHYWTCDYCSEYVYDGEEATEVAGGDHVCKYCRDASFTKCERCGTWVHDSDVEVSRHGYSVCKECYATGDNCVRCGDNTALDEYHRLCRVCVESENNPDAYDKSLIDLVESVPFIPLASVDVRPPAGVS